MSGVRWSDTPMEPITCHKRARYCERHRVWLRCISVLGHTGPCGAFCQSCRVEARGSVGQQSFGVVA